MRDEWVTDRKPDISMLKSVFKREDYAVYGNRFLVTDNEYVWIDSFTMTPREDGKSYNTGYWQGDIQNKIVGWMTLPNAKIKE